MDLRNSESGAAEKRHAYLIEGDAKSVDRTVQELYQSLLRSGAIGPGMAISDIYAPTLEDEPVPLVYRTKERDWVLVANAAVSRSTFLKLAEASMGHALDNEGVSTENGIACHTIDADLKSSAERLSVNVFKVDVEKTDVRCGFCGSPMSGAKVDGGWNSCPRCSRLFGDAHRVRICPLCLGAFGSVPELEEKLKGIAVDTGTSWPTMTFCPSCRVPEQRNVFVLDTVVRGVAEGTLGIDKLKEMGLPREFLQLINLRTQARR